MNTANTPQDQNVQKQSVQPQKSSVNMWMFATFFFALLSAVLGYLVYTRFPQVELRVEEQPQEVQLSESSPPPTPTPLLEYKSKTRVSSYESKNGKVRITFPEPLFVEEIFWDARLDTGAADTYQGEIIISNREDLSGEHINDSKIAVVYGIPAIYGKGGGCSEEAIGGGYQRKVLYGGQPIEVCELTTELRISYPKHPREKIEYEFIAHGNTITSKEFELYKGILLNRITFL